MDNQQNNYKDLKDIATKLQELEKSNFVQKNKGALDDLLQAADLTGVIPEAVFQTYFLNFFVRYLKNKGRLLGTTEQIKADEHTLRKWLEISNGPYNEVKVISANNQVVLTVPSIYLKDTNVIEKLTDFNFNAMAKTYLEKSAILQEMGHNDMVNRMKDLPKFIDTHNANKQKQMWIEVVNYYRRTVLDKEKKVTEPHPDVKNEEPLNNVPKPKEEDLGLDL